jgi:LysR family transcriptional regulator (chromosome initiation inhibitor)
MLDRERLEAFATVVELQSFGKAGKLLKVTSSAISQRVQGLEESLGCILLVRTRPMHPTEKGYVLLRYIQTLRLLEDETLQIIKGENSVAIKMALGVNADSLATWFRPVLAKLHNELNISVELTVDDQDHTAGLLQRGEVMGCVSVEVAPPKGFVAEHLGAMRYLCVANKQFAGNHFANGFNMNSVLQATAVLFNRKDKIHDNFLAEHLRVRVENFPKHYIPSPEALYDAVATGMGYGLVPEAQALDDLRAGRLVRLVPERPLDIALYWHHWTVEPNISAAVTASVKECAASSLYQSENLKKQPRRFHVIR